MIKIKFFTILCNAIFFIIVLYNGAVAMEIKKSLKFDESFYDLLSFYNKLDRACAIDIGMVKRMEHADGGYSITLDSGNSYFVDREISNDHISDTVQNNLGFNAGVGIITYDSGESEWFPARLGIKANPMFIVDDKQVPLNDASLYEYDKKTYEEQLYTQKRLVDAIRLYCPPVPSDYTLHLNSPWFQRNYLVLKNLLGDKAYKAIYRTDVLVDLVYVEFKSLGYVLIAIQPTAYGE